MDIKIIIIGLVILAVAVVISISIERLQNHRTRRQTEANQDMK